jgi:hypothetical protein
MIESPNLSQAFLFFHEFSLFEGPLGINRIYDGEYRRLTEIGHSKSDIQGPLSINQFEVENLKFEGVAASLQTLNFKLQTN